MSISETAGINLNGITHRCQQESEKFFQRESFDPRFCFELFRRAIMLRDNLAWERIFHQYHRLVLSWIERHPIYAALDEEADYFLNRAFEKMWLSLTPQKFADFTDLKAILRYLQLCVHSCIIDYSRAREKAILLEEGVEAEAYPLSEQEDAGHRLVEQQASQHIQSRALWDWLVERLKTEQERCVMYGMFVLAMKPREVADTYSSVFTHVDEVYTNKENVLARLRRDPEIVRFLGRQEDIL